MIESLLVWFLGPIVSCVLFFAAVIGCLIVATVYGVRRAINITERSYR